MAYEPSTWADGEAGGTPITAAALNKIEQGVGDASTAAEKKPTWGQVSGKPSTFPPADHTHTVADFEGLQDILDGKQASGNYATTSALAALVTRVEALEAANEPESG